MKKKPVTNIAASVHARLLNATRQRAGDFNLTLQRYAAERFLYRLGASPLRERFVLKGAMLFVLWEGPLARSTRDLDFAGYWENDATSLATAFREICSVSSPLDGLEFRPASLQIEPIRDASEYHGFRVHLDIGLGPAVLRLQVDVGFGDVVVPPPMDVVYPVLLDGEAPRIRAYPREAVVAEKLHAMVFHGEANSRYKDFLDIHVLSQRYPFEGPTLTAAISATFDRRHSATFAPWPVAFSAAFYADSDRAEQWLRYVKRSKFAAAPAHFTEVGERIGAFLEPPVRAITNAEPFDATWSPAGPWQ